MAGLFENILTNIKEKKQEGKLKGGYRFSDDGKLSVGGGYYDDDKMLEVEIGKDGGNILFKKRFADGGEVKKANKTNLTEETFVKLRLQKKNLNHKEFADYLNNETKYYPDPKQASKFSNASISRRYDIAKSKGKFPLNFVIKGSIQDRTLTPEKYKSVIGEKDYLKLKNNPTKLKNRYEFELKKANDPDFLKMRAERNLAKTKAMSPLEYEEKILEPARKRNQKLRGDTAKFTVNRRDAKSMAWKDLVSRSYETANRDPYFKFETPIKAKKKYNTADMKKIVLIDKNGNKFTYDTLFKDIEKTIGEQEFKNFKNTYEQRVFLNKEGITSELNKLYKIEPGQRKSVFNIQHIEGFNKNPFKIHMTFGNQNLNEAYSRKSFTTDFGKADTYSKKKAIINKYYKSLGPDIVAQIGKQPKGTAPLLTKLLTELKDTKGNTITSPIIEDAIKNLSKAENSELNGLKKNQIATVKRFAAKNGIQLNSFAGVVDLSQSGLTMPPAVKNALKTIVKYGGKTLRGVGKGAIVLDPIFVAADENRADRRGAGALDKTQYIGESFVQGLINLPTTLTGAGTFASDFLKGKRGEDLKFKSDILYTPKSFAEENLEENLKETPIKKRARNLEFNMLSAGGYRDPKLADPEYQKLMESMSIKDIKDIIKKGDIKAKSYGIGTLPREVAKPTKYDIYYDPKKVYNN